MSRIAIVVTDRKIWTGGYNYLLNLVEVSGRHLGGKITPVLFFGSDISEEDVAPFSRVAGAEIVRSPALNQSRRNRAFANALIWGLDPKISALFDEHHVDVIVEAAQFFGWRLRQPVVAWMPDFQHRMMRHLFDRRAYWRRESGFRVQIAAGRSIILSSDDARNHCERFYPDSRGRIHVLRFAVAARPQIDAAELNRIRESYGLPQHFYFLPNQFWRHKNHECVIRALGSLKKAGGDAVVAASGNPLDRGDPDHWSRLNRLVTELGVTGNFRFLGMIPAGDLHALMQQCVAMINPSLSEGWSTTVEEAKSAGTPMILSDLPVHHEQAGEAASFFDPRSPEQLARVLQEYVPLDAEGRAVAAARGAANGEAASRRYAEEFSRVISAATERAATR